MSSTTSIRVLEPALKAYALGYAADALPAILKALVRFFTLELKRLNTIRRNAKGKGVGGKEGRAPATAAASPSSGLRATDLLQTLQAIPTLLKSLLKAMVVSLGISKSNGYHLGMAPACALAIFGWSLLNNALNLLLPSSNHNGNGFRIGSDRRLSNRHSEIVTCFLSSTIAATGALTLLQITNQQQLTPHPTSSSSSSSSTSTLDKIFKDKDSFFDPSSKQQLNNHRHQKFFSFLSAPSPSSYFSSSTTSTNDKTGPGNRASERQGPKITPTPLAPGGHFLARLTSLSLGSFSNPSSPSNSRPQTPQLPSFNEKGSSRIITPSRSTETLISQPIARRSEETFKEGELAAQLENALIRQQQQEAEQGGKFIRREASQGSASSPSQSTSPVLSKRSLSHESQSQASTSAPNLDLKSKPSFTIDLTLFALVRGMDTLVRAAPLIAGALARSKSGAKASDVKGKGRAGDGSISGILRKIGSGLASQAEGLVFVVCCAQIMWAWFYHPERLPPSYVRWISGLASMDHRLLRLLRAVRNDDPYHWNYGDETSNVTELRDLAESLGYPVRWGDANHLFNTKKDAQKAFAQAEREATSSNSEKQAKSDAEPGLTIQTSSYTSEGSSRKVQAKTNYALSGASGPRGRGQMGGLPCEIVHCGMGGSSCLANAGLRWLKGFKVCMGIYVPVHLLPRLIFGFKAFVDKPGDNLWKVLKGSARSASFLATFIASIWFMVCFARTLVLPRVFDLPFSFWDSGLGPGLGSIACGFAVFIEEKRKRAEMALYVAPRALFAVAESLKPGWLSQGKKSALWTERFLFGIALGIVMTSGRFRPDLLRGITSTMAWVVKDASKSKKPIPVSS